MNKKEKFDNVIKIFTQKGVTSENIEYTISAIKEGTKREFILESLTADYRGMDDIEANEMIDAFYKVHGGEFKNESRGGYLYGSIFLVVGLLKVCLSIANKSWTEISKDASAVFIIGGISILIAFYFYIKAYRGSFREKDRPTILR